MFFNLSILLYIYLVLLAVWLFFMLAGIYHMLKFGFKGIITPAVILVFTGVAFLMLLASALYMAQIDWQAGIHFFEDEKMDEPSVFGY